MALAVVTGSSSGIGLATAVALARAGPTRSPRLCATSMLARRSEKSPLMKTSRFIPPSSMLDHDDPVREGFAKIVGQHGPNRHSGQQRWHRVAEARWKKRPLDVFRQVMETNFFGGLRCIKTVITSMRERRQGTIVNVTSIAGRLAMTPQASYAASKWAFEALSECLAQEMRGFNVRVAIVELGVIATSGSSQKRALFCRIARIRISF